MARYELVFRKSVSRDFLPIPKKDVARILKRIEALQEDPRPGASEKLSGLERYRVGQGGYRILYEITDHHLIFTVVKVAHRRYAYRSG
ncbi:MAG: type II toxin-antitoxin system RelE/ParE family toxin [Gammaproteobacteria bacterium]|nr:type II toxin-antitoxin system RelE/ParE family toxin [Gammaproteobacteria bacterium]